MKREVAEHHLSNINPITHFQLFFLRRSSRDTSTFPGRRLVKQWLTTNEPLGGVFFVGLSPTRLGLSLPSTSTASRGITRRSGNNHRISTSQPGTECFSSFPFTHSDQLSQKVPSSDGLLMKRYARYLFSSSSNEFTSKSLNPMTD